MARRDYGFVRSYASIGRDISRLRALMDAGYGGALLDYEDPYLAQAIRDARAAGIPIGIWGDPHGRSPEAFAQLMGQLSQQYNPDMIVPDIEFVGKGYKGSAGWEYNNRLAAALRQYAPNQRTAITVMPNQQDFNYGAYGPNTEWLPQAYGANPDTDVYDPNQVVQTLVGMGVDPKMISPVLGRGHKQGYGGASLWTIDDFGNVVPKAYAQAAQPPGIGGQAAPTTSPQKQNSRYVGPPTLNKPARKVYGIDYGRGFYRDPRGTLTYKGLPENYHPRTFMETGNPKTVKLAKAVARRK